MFPRRTGLTFDPVAAATIAADMAIGGLLNPERAARLVEFHARDASNPGLHDVVNALAERLRASTRTESPAALALRAAQAVFARRLMDLAADENASSDVRGIAAQFITQVPSLLTVPGQGVRTPEWAAHHAALEAEATRFLARPAAPYTPQKPLPVPAGDPIGQP